MVKRNFLVRVILSNEEHLVPAVSTRLTFAEFRRHIGDACGITHVDDWGFSYPLKLYREAAITTEREWEHAIANDFFRSEENEHEAYDVRLSFSKRTSHGDAPSYSEAEHNRVTAALAAVRADRDITEKAFASLKDEFAKLKETHAKLEESHSAQRTQIAQLTTSTLAQSQALAALTAGRAPEQAAEQEADADARPHKVARAA